MMIKMSPADGNPGQRPLYTLTCRFFPSQSKSPPALETSSSTLCFTSVQQTDSDGWFYFRPSAHMPKYSLGLCASTVKPPWEKKNLFGSTSCHTSWVLINQDHSFIIVASIRMNCLLHQLSLPVTIAHGVHIQTHTKYFHSCLKVAQKCCFC